MFFFRHEQQEVLYRHHLIISYLCCFIHSCLCGTFCTVCSLGLVPILLVSSKGNQLDRRRRHLVDKQSKWFSFVGYALVFKTISSAVTVRIVSKFDVINIIYHMSGVCKYHAQHVLPGPSLLETRQKFILTCRWTSIQKDNRMLYFIF